MQNQPINPVAFKGKRKGAPLEERLRRVTYMIVAACLIGFLIPTTKIFSTFKSANCTEKNSFRFGVLCTIIFLILAVYIYIRTWGIHENRSERMMKDHPIPAFSMTFAFLFALFSFFFLFLDVMGFLGAIFYFAICVFLYNALIAFSC
ncbi:hypothetical protein TVAG_453830 [Trichomonas vaginalis G3]|uniref:Transmembrane protein n=1 Tax=Trichomonas vaginalis (strain ATCC PRA-98 / G3) TaxID=412133 RepID=A2DPV9_TRIV3|nr:hypothetical protein TVAGG3_0552290 [Trichomonas vaginalis G3]EAY17555.1 hypothetical protein TVAG_453830 [Trichomonas vaginalis G3]KAI5520599.1 hypothetical protein TVAGG3_0552290 [Trichomonas vaginalis G3]|eukprot:XP_001329690.1 hypothetical protein [Trichomonas vaginalis G3]